MAKKVTKQGLPPLDWLKVFEAAGRHGSFTAAAEEFGATQAAVSQRIRNLESWLGRQLFIRSARGVSLTVDGESYLPLVHDSLRALEQGTENLFGQTVRELRIAGLPSHLEMLLLPRLAVFSKTFPDLRLVTETVPRRLDFEAADGALQIRYGRGGWVGRQEALLANEVLQPMTAPGLAEDWRQLPAIELRGERPGWAEWSRVTGEAAPEAGSLSVDSMAHALRAARLGLGVVLGSRVLAANLLQTGQLDCARAPELPTIDGYWLTWPPSLGKSKRQSEILTALTFVLQG
ncbi:MULTISPECIES: LysR family transcriptional regulator [Leisingera]|jgi:LysR family glycine cleavage system transcriptional activator|uniref:LysR family transcriptional regulator n=1 Tax=Leisingera TaxID=191028 RepID=UPI00114E370B|nr:MULTISPECIES: LysR family transcriptional regulator [Leisingera]QDI75779.1 LysR family transcriptional regulator [Leisingera aquaemixtae]